MAAPQLLDLQRRELGEAGALGTLAKMVIVKSSTDVAYVGIAYQMIAGENLNDGEIVRLSQSADDRVIKVQANGDMPIGVCYGSALSGENIWIICEGFANVQFEAGKTPTRGYLAFVSGTAGRADNSATVPATVTHFMELGHVVATGASGGKQVVKLHFN